MQQIGDDVGFRRMTDPETAELLDQPLIAVLAAYRETSLQVPVWYLPNGSFPPGKGDEFTVLTNSKSLKVKYLRASGRASLCIQTEDPPRYLSIEGPAELRPEVSDEDVHRIAHRYLPPEAAEQFIQARPDDTTITITAESWRTGLLDS